jgi:Flp pilus assembly protein TadG
MNRIRRFVRRRQGTSYSLPFVMVLPLYLLTVLFIVEVGLLAITRLGVQYATFQGTRTASLAQPLGESVATEKTRETVLTLLAPFVRGSSNSASGRTEIQLEFHSREVQLRVNYRAPLRMPVIRRFFDSDGQAPFERTLVAEMRFALLN